MKKSVVAASIAGLGLASAAMAQNTGAVLTAGTATYRIGGGAANSLNTNGSATSYGGPAMDLFLTGTSENLFGDWWFYRSGADNREFSLANATSRVVNTSDATYGYNLTNGLTASLRYDFSSPGANTALVTQTMVVTNPGSTPMPLSLFHYVDTQLGGADAGDAATLTTPNSRMMLTDTGITVDWWANGASNYQVGTWPAIRDVLSNALVNDLNNTGLPYTSTDWTGAFQWILEVPAGGSVTVVSSYGFNTAAVPAPGVAALLGLGGLAAARRRR